MLVISQNLSGLVRATGLCDDALVEEFSIQLLVGPQIRRMRDTPSEPGPVVYGSPYATDRFFEPEEMVERDIHLAPGARLLACTVDRYRMPPSYFGLVQTKGSLARLFVSATCNDGQVEPGYEGRITLEISNDARYPVILPVGSNVAQLFVFRCTTTAAKPYNGRYQHAPGPTLATFDMRE